MVKIDKRAVQRVADSYRDWALEFDLSLEDVEKAIIIAAQQASNCVNCAFGIAPQITPAAKYRRSLPIMARGCILGLSFQVGCTARKPIIE